MDHPKSIRFKIFIGTFIFFASACWSVPAGAVSMTYILIPDTGTLTGSFTVDFDTIAGFTEWNFSNPDRSDTEAQNILTNECIPVTPGLKMCTLMTTIGLETFTFRADDVTTAAPRMIYGWEAGIVGVQFAFSGFGDFSPVMPPVPSPIPTPTTFLLTATSLLVLAGYGWLQRRREPTQVG